MIRCYFFFALLATLFVGALSLPAPGNAASNGCGFPYCFGGSGGGGSGGGGRRPGKEHIPGEDPNDPLPPSKGKGKGGGNSTESSPPRRERPYLPIPGKSDESVPGERKIKTLRLEVPIPRYDQTSENSMIYFGPGYIVYNVIISRESWYNQDIMLTIWISHIADDKGWQLLSASAFFTHKEDKKFMPIKGYMPTNYFKIRVPKKAADAAFNYQDGYGFVDLAICVKARPPLRE